MEQRYGKQKGGISRSCSKCGGDLGDRFGKQRYCKACHAENMRKTRPKHSELAPEARKKANCRGMSKHYMKKGLIIKTPCLKCGSENVQMHHEDYNKPLEVMWFCRPCHLEYHKIHLKRLHGD